MPKGKCVCGVCPHCHVDNCKETTLKIKVRFEIAQSRPRAEGELPLPPPPALNKYAFLTGLKVHAGKTWMLKMLRATRTGAKHTRY